MNTDNKTELSILIQKQFESLYDEIKSLESLWAEIIRSQEYEEKTCYKDTIEKQIALAEEARDIYEKKKNEFSEYIIFMTTHIRNSKLFLLKLMLFHVDNHETCRIEIDRYKQEIQLLTFYHVKRQLEENYNIALKACMS
jgi:hypothetical protein